MFIVHALSIMSIDMGSRESLLYHEAESFKEYFVAHHQILFACQVNYTRPKDRGILIRLVPSALLLSLHPRLCKPVDFAFLD